jgi:transposase
MALTWDDADPLPTDVPTLHAMVRHLRTELTAVRAELAAVNAKLDKLLAVHFRRSERAKRPRTPPPDADRPPRPRHRHGRSPLPDHLERRVEVHDLTAAERACPCCGVERERIGEQAAEQLDCDPIRYFVRRTIRVSYACRRCPPTAVPAEHRLVTAGPSTVGPIPKGLCGPGLLAYTLTAKYADHLPLHRLAGVIARSGVTVSTSTLGDWVRQAAALLTPLCQWMHRRVLAAPVIWTDDTRVSVRVPGRKTTATGHLWVTVGDHSAPYTTFHFTRGYAAADGPDQFLNGYTGWVHADCLAQYDGVFAAGGRHVACWAHARRKLLDAGEPAAPAVALVGRLYRLERDLPPPDTPDRIARRTQARQARAVPILSELHAWLTTASATALPRSPLGEAARYVLTRWHAFTRFTTDGRLSIDNNLAERTLRAIAVGRSNWTFVGSADAGHWAAVHSTVVGTCRHLGIDPFAYLRDVLPRLHAQGENPTDEHLPPLLPDRWLADRPASTSTNSAA